MVRRWGMRKRDYYGKEKSENRGKGHERRDNRVWIMGSYGKARS